MVKISLMIDDGDGDNHDGQCRFLLLLLMLYVLWVSHLFDAIVVCRVCVCDANITEWLSLRVLSLKYEKVWWSFIHPQANNPEVFCSVSVSAAVCGVVLCTQQTAFSRNQSSVNYHILVHSCLYVYKSSLSLFAPSHYALIVIRLPPSPVPSSSSSSC